jgi:thioredoxin 1
MQTTLIILGIIALSLIFLVNRFKKQLKFLDNVKGSHKINELTDQNFSHKIKEGTALVDFWASWCVPCKIMVPVLNELSEEMEGKVMIGKINIDEQKATAARFGVRSIPTLIIFRNGREIKRFTGVKTKDYLVNQLNNKFR